MTGIKIGELFGNLSIHSWYRYLLYVSGVIFILSFFLEPVKIEISNLRAFSVNTIVLGLILWTIENLYNWTLDMFNYEINMVGEMSDFPLGREEIQKHRTKGNIVSSIWLLINIIALVIWFLFILPIVL